MSIHTIQDFEYGSDNETEMRCNFCGEDRFRTSFGQSVHSTYYCQQNPNRLPAPVAQDYKSFFYDGPQYYYPVEQDLARQEERRTEQTQATNKEEANKVQK
jgi:hypothetical protein